jgi:uncharacterized protein YeaO (DUF488 family)
LDSVNLRTKRWNDPVGPDDGYRILVCRFRPRGVPRQGEPWDVWMPELGPSKELHAAVYGKLGEPISWDEYAARYRFEMRRPTFWLSGLAERVAKGEVITLLCSSACIDPARCHRSLLKTIVEGLAAPASPAPSTAPIRRRARG